jgi:hypothetical protein
MLSHKLEVEQGRYYYVARNQRIKCVENQTLKTNSTFYWFVHVMIISEKCTLRNIILKNLLLAN